MAPRFNGNVNLSDRLSESSGLPSLIDLLVFADTMLVNDGCQQHYRSDYHYPATSRVGPTVQREIDQALPDGRAFLFGTSDTFGIRP
jgi:hypothetical protein